MQQPVKKSIAKTYFIYFICMVLFCCVRIASTRGIGSDLGEPLSDIVFTLIIQVGIMFIIPAILYMLFLRVKPKALFKTCNFYKINKSTFFISIALGIVLFLINLVVSSIFNGFITFTGYKTPFYFGEVIEPDYSMKSFALQVILVAVLPAFAEEFLHRGILLQGTKHMGFYKSIAVSAICFGLIHFNVGQVGYAIVLGLIMGFCSVVAKNIWVPMIMHFMNNFIAVYLEFATANGWFLGNYSDVLGQLATWDLWAVCLVCFIALSIICVALFYLVALLYRQAILKRVDRAIQRVYGKDIVGDEPVIVDKGRVIQEMLENNTMINLDYEEMKNPIEMVMPKQKEVYIPTFKDNIFLICSIFLGTLITIFTFVWGFI